MQFQGQFFSIEMDIRRFPEGADIEYIHKQEWVKMQKILNGHGYNPKDNSRGYHNEQTQKRLDHHLKAYTKDLNHKEKDFLVHLQEMLERDKSSLYDRALYTTESWLSRHFVLLGQKTKKGLPKEFAEKHWKRIVKLIEQHDGNVMGAVKEFCTDFKEHHDIGNLTRAVNRLCETRKVPHNRNI